MYLPVNTILRGGTYRIIHFISSGGFGCTYEAEHIMLEKRVAIKEFFVKDFCNRDESTAHVTVGTLSKKGLVDKLRRKFIDEAKALCRLQNSGIVSVQDVFEENGTAYFVMDYVDGKSLSEIVREQGSLPEERAVRYIRQVATALQYVHDNNRLHLDIKPGNIMIDGNDNPVLIDFGASKQYDEEDGENTSTLMGKTPGYAPPEQMSNSVVKFLPATDIYALGATLYKLLTGITPLDVNLRISGEELEPLPTNITAATRNAITAAMEINKNKRPQSLNVFIRLLDYTSNIIENNDTTFEVDEPVVSKIKESIPKKIVSIYNPKTKQEHSFLDKNKWYVIGFVIVAIPIIGYIIYANNMPAMPVEKTQPSEDVQKLTHIVNEQRKNIDKTAEQVLLSEEKLISIDMVYVEGGTFTMGALPKHGDDADEYEKPVHNVTLSSYYIGKYEVTQAQWKEVMGSNPSFFKGDNLPVENVSWNDTQIFIRKLNEKTGNKYRLPTEAEWEFAARGGNRSRGFKYSGNNSYSVVAWHYKNSGKNTHPVGSKGANELGIYDMSGNVWEWCQDWYSDYNATAQTNPKGPAAGKYKVKRGGSWHHHFKYCRNSARSSDKYLDSKQNYNGLRLAMDAQ